MKTVIASYERLSLDDGADRESNSITNQRLIIRKYIESKPELAAQEVVDYTDDGYTGTNFNRPAMQQLLLDIIDGKVAAVIVKDLSRFGRNFVEVGRYIEEVLPRFGVRFISVGDGYDSGDKTTEYNLMMKLKAMLHELHSRDTSYKVKSGKQMMAKQGSLYSTQTVYGYKTVLDKHGAKTWEIDEPAAKIVREVYSLYLGGMAIKEIARKLNDRGELSPLEYKNSVFGRDPKKNQKEKTLWTYHSLKRILRAEEYTGKYISLKRESGELGSGKSKPNNREDWVVIPDKHPAIISVEEFEEAGKLFRVLHKTRGPDKERLFKRKIYCGHCKSLMTFRELSTAEYNFFSCKNSGLSGQYSCAATHFREYDVAKTVLEVLKMSTSLFVDTERARKIVHIEMANAIAASNKERNALESQLKKLQGQKRLLYEEYRAGKYSSTQYTELKDQIAEQVEAIETKLRESVDRRSQKPDEDELEKLLKTIEDAQYPTKLMIDTFIDRIVIHENWRMEIKFKASSPFAFFNRQ